MEQDFSKKLTIVVRKDLAGWEAANTIAHISAYIGHKLENAFGTGEIFITQDKKEFPRNSQYPIIIKRAGSSEQLQTLLTKIREGNYLYHAFIREMINSTDDSEIETTLSTKNDADIELLGIGVFGSHEDVGALTKKFGLWE